MASHRDFLQRIETRASQLEQKASFPTGRLRKEIGKIAAKPEPDRLGESRLDGLIGLSRALRQVRRGNVQEEARELVRRMDLAQEELGSISEQVDASVVEAHTSIISDASIPAGFYDTLTDLFGRSQSLERVMEEGMKRLQQISEELERANTVCDEFLKTFSIQKKPAKGTFDKAYFKQFDVESLNSLRHMLLGIANLFVLPHKGMWKLSPTAARAAGKALLNAPRYEFLTYAEERKKEDFIKYIKGKLMRLGRRSGKATSQLQRFRRISDFHRAVTEAMPPELIVAERVFLEYVRDAIVSLADCSARLLDRASRYQLKHGPGGDFEEVKQLSQPLFDAIKSERCSSYLRRMFLVELASSNLESLGFILSSGDFDDHLEDEATLRYLSSVAYMLSNSLYTRKDVWETFKQFGLPQDLLSLIQPLNFILDHEAVQGRVRSAQRLEDLVHPDEIDPALGSPNMASFIDLDSYEMFFLPDVGPMPSQIIFSHEAGLGFIYSHQQDDP